MVKVIMLGTDPEFFLQKDGKHVCAIPFVGMGTKDNPMPMVDENGVVKEGYSFMHDRASVEFNVPPTIDFEEFKKSIEFAMAYIMTVVNGDYNKAKVTASDKASVWFEWSELQDPKSMEIGCQPSWNAYTLEQNEAPDVSDIPLQTAAFHFHIQVDFGDLDKYDTTIAFVKALDLFLGLPSLLLDKDTERRKLYGKAGEFREHLDDDRFEYRVISNFLLFNPEALEFMWNQIFKAAEFISENKLSESDEEKIRMAINTSDVELATSLCEQFKIEVPCIKQLS